MMEANQTPRTMDAAQEAVHIAREIYRQKPHWLTFFREVLGVGGIVRRLFPEDGDYVKFERSEGYAEIQQMLTELRGLENTDAKDKEPLRVITVRLPSSLHEALRAEAFSHQTSMNQLCIAKLLRAIDQQQSGETRGESQELPRRDTVVHNVWQQESAAEK